MAKTTKGTWSSTGRYAVKFKAYGEYMHRFFSSKKVAQAFAKKSEGVLTSFTETDYRMDALGYPLNKGKK